MLTTTLPVITSLALLVFTVKIHDGAGASTCGGPAVRSAIVKHALPNLVLNNHALRVASKRSPFKCVIACLKENRCASVNYGDSEGVCVLNRSSIEEFPADVMRKDGWRYYGSYMVMSAEELCRTTTAEVVTTTAAPTTTVDITTTDTTTVDTTTVDTTTVDITTVDITTVDTTTVDTTTVDTTTVDINTVDTTTVDITTVDTTTVGITTVDTTTTLPTTIVTTTTEKPPTDCWDVQASSPSSLPSGVYTVYPDTRAGSLEVYCDMATDGGGWTVFQRRKDGTQDFYLGWNSYKAGFGDVANNFWLGNDALNELTSQQDYLIRIDMESFSSTTTYAMYGIFKVDTEANKYQLTLGTFYGSYIAGNSFTFHNGQSFSTSDQDNDIDGTRHCAQVYLGAWWFKSCIACCLNGPYSNDGSQLAPGQGVVWGEWLTLYTSMKSANMKIRPVSAHPAPPKDCWDHYVRGETVSGLYNIYVTGLPTGLQVYCDMDDKGGGWTLVQRRVDGSVDFYKFWNDYKNGFGVITDNFWLGNDNIHLLTNQDSYQLTVKLQSWNLITKYANYDNFLISNEADLYRLSISGFYGSNGIGDSLTYHDGMAWSTRDQENDLDDERHCAEAEIGAWWYNSCEQSNLNGPYIASPGTIAVDNSGEGIVWGTWKFQTYSFKLAEMKIRPTHVGFVL